MTYSSYVDNLAAHEYFKTAIFENPGQELISEKGDSSLVADLEDQIESLKANINYLHENIQDCQQNILQMEQAAGESSIGRRRKLFLLVEFILSIIWK